MKNKRAQQIGSFITLQNAKCVFKFTSAISAKTHECEIKGQGWYMNQRCILFYNHLTFVYTYLHILNAYLNETKYWTHLYTVGTLSIAVYFSLYSI